MIKTFFEMKDADVRPMTSEEAGIFLGLSIREMGKSEPLNAYELHALAEKDNWPFGLKVLVNRLCVSNNDDLRYTPEVVLLCGAFSTNPGSAVMWAYTLVREALKRGKPINISVFTECLPWGIPTDDAKRRLWNEQKHYRGVADNWLDASEAYRPESELAD